jgi:hypothetical protein
VANTNTDCALILLTGPIRVVSLVTRKRPYSGM